MNVPYIDDDKIYHLADNFLLTHHPSLSIPIPIEQIIEIKIGLNIFPIKDLESGCGIDGSLSNDFKTILIDEYVFEKSIQRARFTLAHEIAHYILHKEIFIKSGGFNTKNGFIDFQNNLGEKDYKRMEIQAYRFAEEILFPKAVLEGVIQQNIKDLGGLDSLIPIDFEKITTSVSKKFDVSYKAAVNKVSRDFRSLIEIVTSNNPF